MKPEVHQALGNVHDLDPGSLLEGTRIENKLVSHESVFAGIEYGEVFLHALGHIVGVQDRDLGGFRQPLRSHERDVDPGNCQDARTAVGRGRNRSDGVPQARG